MFSALQSSQVDVVMLDMFSLASRRDILDQKFLKVRKLINTNTGYGFILSGSSYILGTDVNSLLPSKQKEIQKFLEEMESKIPVRTAYFFNLRLHLSNKIGNNSEISIMINTQNLSIWLYHKTHRSLSR